jgi:ribosomal protein S18 acetylase RimI-like enzyme
LSTHENPMVRPALVEDLEEMVRVHLRAFPGFFLAQAGPRFIREYYRSVLEYTPGIALVAPGGGPGLAGFVSGFADSKRFYAFYRSRRRRLAAALVPALLRRPWLVARALGNARRIAHEEGEAGAVELSSIAVDPARGGQGVGSGLLRAFLAEAARRGARSAILTTDARGNDPVNAFYQREGFRADRVVRHGRREMVRYRIDLAPADDAAIERARGLP